MGLSIGSFSFDQNLYNPGDTITLTVNYTSNDYTGGQGNVGYTTSVTVSDAVSSASRGSIQGSNNFPQLVVNTGEQVIMPTTVTATDTRTPPGAWTLVSNVVTGTVPTYNFMAVLTSIA